MGGKVQPNPTRSDDARPFGHNTAALAVLITLQGYRWYGWWERI